MNRYANPSNFGHPIRTPLLREHFVYRCYDADGKLLYIGCSRRWEKRLQDHKVASRWARDVARVRVEGPYNYETARQVEYEAIESERSLHNYSSERRAIHRSRDKIIDRQFAFLLSEGLPVEDALSRAVQGAEQWLPEASRYAPLDDLSVLNAKRAVKRHADWIAGAA